MKHWSYILAVVSFGLMLIMFFSDNESVEIIDREDYFEGIIDGLISKNNDQNEIITGLREGLHRQDFEIDSLLEYQNKMYIHHAKEIQSIYAVHDSLVYRQFQYDLR